MNSRAAFAAKSLGGFRDVRSHPPQLKWIKPMPGRRKMYQPAAHQHEAQEVTSTEGDVEGDSASAPGTPGSRSSPSWRAGLASVNGQVLILGTAVLWGTNPPAVRYLYTSGGSPAPSILAACQCTLAATLLLGFTAALRAVQRSQNTAVAAPADSTELERLRSGGVEQQGNSGTEHRADSISPGLQPLRSIRGALNAQTWDVRLAGAELGLWAFLANACTVLGFEHTTASRGAFLIRLSAIFTPIVASISGDALPGIVWAGCLMALSGSIALGSSHSDGGGDTGSLLAAGDLLLVGAAVLWSIETVRIEKHLRRLPGLELSSYELATMAALSATWLGVDAAQAVSRGDSLDSLWHGYGSLTNWAILLWPAVGPWGIGKGIQAIGQKTTSSSQTQILLASDPLWATLFSGLLGSGEQALGAYGLLGGGAIVGGAVVAGVGSARREDQKQRNT